MFPNDAISVYGQYVGDTTGTLIPSGEKTILAVSMQQEKDLSNTIISCGVNAFAKNYGKDLPQINISVECDENIIITKTGNDEASIVVTYVPYHMEKISTTSENVMVVGGPYAGPTFYEWLFVAGVIIFFLSYLTWGRLSFIREKNT